MSTSIAETNLAQLVEEINRVHHQAEEALNEGLAHAFRCGELLVEAKAQCEHGQWINWLEENFDGTARSAQGYMKVAGRREEIEAHVKRVSHLPLREALRLTAEPKAEKDVVAADEGALPKNVYQDVLSTLPELDGWPLVGLEGLGDTGYGRNHDSFFLVEITPPPLLALTVVKGVTRDGLLKAFGPQGAYPGHLEPEMNYCLSAFWINESLLDIRPAGFYILADRVPVYDRGEVARFLADMGCPVKPVRWKIGMPSPLFPWVADTDSEDNRTKKRPA